MINWVFPVNFNALPIRYYQLSIIRVSDPHWFNADPDPAFYLIADPDPDLDPDPVSNLKIEKILQLEKIDFLYQKLQFTYP